MSNFPCLSSVEYGTINLQNTVQMQPHKRDREHPMGAQPVIYSCYCLIMNKWVFQQPFLMEEILKGCEAIKKWII